MAPRARISWRLKNLDLYGIILGRNLETLSSEMGGNTLPHKELLNTPPVRRSAGPRRLAAPTAPAAARARWSGVFFLVVALMLIHQSAQARMSRGYSQIFSIRATSSVEIEPNSPPRTTGLAAIYPNPFNPRTTIAFELAEAGVVEVTVFDLRGQRVRVLESGERPVGRHEVTWDGQDDMGHGVATGTYLCRFTTVLGSQSRKMILAR